MKYSSLISSLILNLLTPFLMKYAIEPDYNKTCLRVYTDSKDAGQVALRTVSFGPSLPLTQSFDSIEYINV